MTCSFAGRMVARFINGERGPLVRGNYPAARRHIEECTCELCITAYQRLEDAGWPELSTNSQPSQGGSRGLS